MHSHYSTTDTGVFRELSILPPKILPPRLHCPRCLRSLRHPFLVMIRASLPTHFHWNSLGTPGEQTQISKLRGYSNRHTPMTFHTARKKRCQVDTHLCRSPSLYVKRAFPSESFSFKKKWPARNQLYKQTGLYDGEKKKRVIFCTSGNWSIFTITLVVSS